jgi:hypothetical protein
MLLQQRIVIAEPEQEQYENFELFWRKKSLFVCSITKTFFWSGFKAQPVTTLISYRDDL